MGKFDGILLCSDLDDTLLTTDKQISDGNREAIEYFKSEGGIFTFATGRVIAGARVMLEAVKPNAPVVCFNGAGIYDFENEELLYLKTLDKDAVKAVEFMYDAVPFAAIDVCTATQSYFCRTNKVLEMHKAIENLPDNYIDYRDIKEDWVKVIFMTEPDKTDFVRQTLQDSEFADKYHFVQSEPQYYELLPKHSGKGSGIRRLAQLLEIPIEHTIGIGDNNNDLTLIQDAGVGIAVANAAPEVKQAADCITVDNNSDALKAIIGALDKGMLLKLD